MSRVTGWTGALFWLATCCGGCSTDSQDAAPSGAEANSDLAGGGSAETSTAAATDAAADATPSGNAASTGAEDDSGPAATGMNSGGTNAKDQTTSAGGSSGGAPSSAADSGAAAETGTGGAGSDQTEAPEAGFSETSGSSGSANAEGADAATPGVEPAADGKLTVFYLDVGGSVMATDVEDPAARTVVADAGRGPDGLAIDMDQGHIYWTGMGVPSQDNGFVRRADLDGSNIVTVVPEGGTYTPKQLKIDQDNGKLYWSDREGMRVMRANLDGSQIETLVTTGVGADDRSDNSRWCVGIALDLAGGYVYWSQKGSDNAGVGSLRRTQLEMPEGEDSTNRSDIEVLFDGLPEPIDIDLDLTNQKIYWTDRGDDTINRGPIEIPEGSTAADRDDREVLIEGVREAIGVTLDLAAGKLYFTGGTLGRVGMANLDGTDQVDLLNGSAGLTGIVVVSLPE